VTTISGIIQEAAGEEAEIIFGAVHDSHMKEEIRVTVIATGFENAARAAAPMLHVPAPARRAATGGSGSGGGEPVLRLSGTRLVKPVPPQSGQDLQVPTFVRRQMD
jgi:cell division protein FtsZ